MTVTLLLFFAITLLIAFFVAIPMLQRSPRFGLGKIGSNHSANDLVERKESIYSAIKEIEFDYQMGKLSDEDFKALRQQYKDEAVNLLKKIDQVQRRPGKSSGQTKRATKKQTSPNYCWVCGTAVTQNDKFCANCGTKIQEQ